MIIMFFEFVEMLIIGSPEGPARFMQIFYFGLGLVSLEIAGREALGHIGNIPGYSSLMAYVPGEKLYLVLLMNQNYLRADDQRVNIEILAEKIVQANMV